MDEVDLVEVGLTTDDDLTRILTDAELDAEATAVADDAELSADADVDSDENAPVESVPVESAAVENTEVTGSELVDDGSLEDDAEDELDSPEHADVDTADTEDNPADNEDDDAAAPAVDASTESAPISLTEVEIEAPVAGAVIASARTSDPRLAELIVEKAQTAGPVVDDPGTTIRYRRMAKRPGTAWMWLVSIGTLAMSVAYAVWLIKSGPPLENRILHAISLAAAIVVVVMVVVEALRLLLIAMLSMSSALVRSPIPVKPHKNLKAALFITFVPSSESLAMLEETLVGAKALEVPTGTKAEPGDEPSVVDIFVLDEGDKRNPELVQQTIDRLNATLPGNTIRRISRLGMEEYNRGKRYETKTKHGNVNAAYDMIKANPELPDYDVLIGLDPDHIPLPQLTSRLLGYFNDPNVAYVAAPQSYANSETQVVPKLAESQQFVFHSLIQTSANAHRGPMLVGTNYAIRTSVFEQIGGAQPSITEDLATGLKAISSRNAETGARWHSVYTPDVLAHGEGPDTWGAYFKQQNRWAMGAMRHVMRGPFIKQMFQSWHAPRRVVHYSLLMAFYPVMAITWVLGAVNAAVFAIWGASGTLVDPSHWVLFYTWALVAQITLFIASRRYNVSPYESDNSWGVYGMFMSVAAAPIYVAALFKSIFAMNPKFDVTPKGATSKKNRDSLFTFRLSLFWAVLYVAIIWRIVAIGYASIATLAWPVIALSLSIAPVVIWLFGTRKRRRARVALAEQEAEYARKAAAANAYEAELAAKAAAAAAAAAPAVPTRTGTAAEILAGATSDAAEQDNAEQDDPGQDDPGQDDSAEANPAQDVEAQDDEAQANGVDTVRLVHKFTIKEIEAPPGFENELNDTEETEEEISERERSVGGN